MTAYTPAELRTLAGSQKTNPFFASQVSAALSYAADALEAADKALQAELARAIAQPEQQADNFAMTEAHVELLATMMHCVPTERELFKDLNAFCHDARTAVNKAAIAQPVQPAPVRQPLTEAEIDGIITKLDPIFLDVPMGFTTEFARALEAKITGAAHD